MSLRQLRPGKRAGLGVLAVVAAFAAYATSELWFSRVTTPARALTDGARSRLQERRDRRADAIA